MRFAASAAALALAVLATAAPPEGAPARFVTSVASALVEQKLAQAAPAGDTSFIDVPHPGVRFVPNVARATNVPWIDSNGWRFLRGVKKANYSKLPAGAAPLAAAEAFTYGVDALFNPDPADVEELGKMFRFLDAQAGPRLPPLTNFDVVDDGSPQMGEILNLLSRRNLMYRVVKRPDHGGRPTVQLGTSDFPADAAKNPYEFAARVRAKVGDDNRLVRVYGTSTVLAHLTGDAARARLHLLSFGGRRRQAQEQRQQPVATANPQAIRVRLVGSYQPTRTALYGSTGKTELTDLRHVGNATEFWMPDFTTFAVVDLVTAPGGSAVIESVFSSKEIDLDPNPSSAAWREAPRAVADHDKSGAILPGPPTEIRSRWTNENLYLLYTCPYDELNLKPDPNPQIETPRLWNWDVAEAFIGSDFENIARYKEFQVSPQSEWVDLDIDRGDPKRQEGMRWNSGYAVAARVDPAAKIWYGLMRIPFRAIDPRAPEKGRELRVGLYRIAGVEPARKYYAWRPTGGASFHMPEAFGTLRLR